MNIMYHSSRFESQLAEVYVRLKTEQSWLSWIGIVDLTLIQEHKSTIYVVCLVCGSLCVQMPTMYDR